MGYLGPAPKFGKLEKQVLTPDSATTQFSLDKHVPSSESVLVIYGGVIQEPGVAYNTGGDTITFTFTPTTGILLYLIFLGSELKSPIPTWTQEPEIDLTSGAPTSVSLLSGLTKVNEIEIQLEAVSTDIDNQAPMIQIGDIGGLAVTGYTGRASHIASGITMATNSTGFFLGENANFDLADGAWISVSIKHMGSNVWALNSTGHTGTGLLSSSGTKQLSGLLDRVTLTTSGGSAVFDVGTAYVMYR